MVRQLLQQQQQGRKSKAASPARHRGASCSSQGKGLHLLRAHVHVRVTRMGAQLQHSSRLQVVSDDALLAARG